ncbi:MAG: RHS repeat-associated core domain-containing protein [Bacteroidota bacterium]
MKGVKKRGRVKEDTGHYYHQPSGLHLAQYRAYDANTGRWISRDKSMRFHNLMRKPETIPDGPSLYNYSVNNPARYIDLLGLQFITPQIDNWFMNLPENRAIEKFVTEESCCSLMCYTEVLSGVGMDELKDSSKEKVLEQLKKEIKSQKKGGLKDLKKLKPLLKKLKAFTGALGNATLPIDFAKCMKKCNECPESYGCGSELRESR